MHNLSIGNLSLDGMLILAPMAGFTDVSFRCLCKRFGASLTVSEMISAKGVFYGDRKTGQLAASSPSEKPFAVQIFGSEPDVMTVAAVSLLRLNPQIGIVDINMGCPMPKITGNGDGSALMKNLTLAGKIVAAVSGAINAPTTVKMRTGWDESSVNAPNLAEICQANGAGAICIHGRTRSQLYRPPVDFETIKKVKKSVTVPVIANGGIYSAEDALVMLEKTGCDGLAVGQGALGNPFIFREISDALSGRQVIKPEPDEIIALACEHVGMICADKGEYTGVKEIRRQLGHYIKGMNGAAEARNRINYAQTKDELCCILTSLLSGLRSGK